MSPFHPAATLAEHYDQGLRLSRNHLLPAGYCAPQPTSFWPQENIILYEHYRDFLLSGGSSELATKIIYLPIAGHVLGLTLKPHQAINLDQDFERAMKYVQAKQCGPDWLKACKNGLNKFRRFLRLERGLGEENHVTPFDSSHVTVELSESAARELVKTILAVLEQAEEGGHLV